MAGESKSLRVFRRWHEALYFSPCATVCLGDQDSSEDIARLIGEQVSGLRNGEVVLAQWLNQDGANILAFRVGIDLERLEL